MQSSKFRDQKRNTQNLLSSWRVIRVLITMMFLGFAIHILFPQIGEFHHGILALHKGRWPFLGITFAGSILTFVAETWAIKSSVNSSPPWIPTFLVELAAFFAATISPASLGWLVINQQFLENYGNSMENTRTAITLFFVLTIFSFLGLLLILLPFIPSLDLPEIHLPATIVIFEIAMVVFVVIGIAVWIPASRRRIFSEMIPVLNALPEIIRNPKRTILMFTAAVLSFLAYGIALTGTVAAFGQAVPFTGVLLAFLIANFAGTTSSSPGGLGVIEMALVAAISRLGMNVGAAVESVLVFRLITFWIPLPFGAWALYMAKKKGWIFVAQQKRSN